MSERTQVPGTRLVLSDPGQVKPQFSQIYRFQSQITVVTGYKAAAP